MVDTDDVERNSADAIVDMVGSVLLLQLGAVVVRSLSAC